MRGQAVAGLVAVFLALAGCATVRADPSKVAVTETGRVLGVLDDNVLAYRGIPFASPPIGELRWRSPQPPRQWQGVRDATAFGPACPQGKLPPPFGVEGPQSEDCLTLNIWAPVTAKRNAKRPVMLWFHGGAYVYGAGSQKAFDGTALASEGVVLVTANYRLGALGFLAHPALSAEKIGQPLGNYGLEDQLAALRWVRRNISAFGGDRENVTMAGESAGAVSVLALMTMPAARGLFARAISQSGGGTAVFFRAGAGSEGDAQGQQWAEAAGLRNASAGDLRGLAVEKVLSTPFFSFPHVDGVLLSHSPGEAFDRGLQAKVPLLIGSNSFEASLAAFSDDLAKVSLGARYAAIERNYRDAFGEGEKAGQQLRGDLFFVAPSRFIANRHAAIGAPAYLYHFDWVAASARALLPGAPHGGELGYLFARPDAWAASWDDRDRTMSRMLIGYWTEFARTGDPNGDGRPKWFPTGPTTARELRLGETIRMAGPSPVSMRMEVAAVAAARDAWKATEDR